MKTHLIKNIEIKNFKCFQDFQVKELKRVNLIGGKNNVGKTAFMEACYINAKALNIKSFVDALYGIKYMRENLNILGGVSYTTQEYIEQSDDIYLKSNINISSFNIHEKEGIKQYNFRCNKQYIKVNINDFSYETQDISNINFIDNFGLSNSDIITNYSTVQIKDEELILNTILNEFDERIEAFKIIDDKPQCKIGDSYFEVTEFGDGVRHLISVVTALYKSENGYLFIDEIDNGIHYSQLDNLWSIILTVSKKQNVQVFATTHSKECIESYARVSQKLGDKDITYTVMSRLKNGEINAGVYDYGVIENSLNQEHEVR